MLNSMALFAFSILDRTYPFWANFVQKIKIVCLRRNLEHRLTRICESRKFIFVVLDRKRSSFCQIRPKNSKFVTYFERKCSFGANAVQIFKFVCLRQNLVLRLIRTSKFDHDVHFLAL